MRAYLEYEHFRDNKSKYGDSARGKRKGRKMEIRHMFLEDEDYLDLTLLKGYLIDDEGCEREFAINIMEQDIVGFEDEGLGRTRAFVCKDFIDKALIREDRLGIFKALDDAVEAIKRNIGETPILKE